MNRTIQRFEQILNILSHVGELYLSAWYVRKQQNLRPSFITNGSMFNAYDICTMRTADINKNLLGHVSRISFNGWTVWVAKSINTFIGHNNCVKYRFHYWYTIHDIQFYFILFSLPERECHSIPFQFGKNDGRCCFCSFVQKGTWHESTCHWIVDDEVDIVWY